MMLQFIQLIIEIRRRQNLKQIGINRLWPFPRYLKEILTVDMKNITKTNYHQDWKNKDPTKGTHITVKLPISRNKDTPKPPKAETQARNPLPVSLINKSLLAFLHAIVVIKS